MIYLNFKNMTDKVQKIREEVQRLHNLLPVMDGDNIYLNYADRICTTLEMYIDSLQEEPVSEDLEEAAKVYEQTRNDLDVVSDNQMVERAFKAGAEWQKKQDQSTIELAEDHAMLAGMNKMEQQMIEKAIDGQLENGEDYLRIKCLSTGCQPQDDGKLVKLIIIKED